jgi:hypothetical protein
MHTVDRELLIRAPIDDVFEWLTDATNFQRSPFVRRVTLVRPGDVAEHGVGAVRLLVSTLMRTTEQIVEYDPPHLLRTKTLNSFPPLMRQNGCMTFSEMEGGTQVHWESQFEVPTKFFGDLWEVILMPFVSMGIGTVLQTADSELRRY